MDEKSNRIGHAVVVMGPTGSGKGTLIDIAKTQHPDLYETVSCTSRTMRPGESDGVEYFFITAEKFREKIEAGHFLEWAEFAGNYYGTLKSEIQPRINSGQVVLLEIELQGVQQLLELLPREHITIVYIEAGGWEVSKQRALARAPMEEADLQKRFEHFVHEEKAKPLADVLVDNSGDLELAKTKFLQVIDSVYSRTNN